MEHVCGNIRKWLAGPSLDPEAKCPGRRWALGVTSKVVVRSEFSFASMHPAAACRTYWKG